MLLQYTLLFTYTKQQFLVSVPYDFSSNTERCTVCTQCLYTSVIGITTTLLLSSTHSES
jgi:hypothetical protein